MYTSIRWQQRFQNYEKAFAVLKDDLERIATEILSGVREKYFKLMSLKTRLFKKTMGSLDRYFEAAFRIREGHSFWFTCERHT
jgi:hypothetical protein